MERGRVTADLAAHRFVFIAGLHRSGTSIVTRCICAHPEISGFHDTGVPEDEGQFLQSVYPVARTFGGPGSFGYDPRAALNETSPLVSEASRDRMYTSWSRYWDLNCPILVEKSPPNIIRARFLQAQFPRSYFVIVVRHPVAVAFATVNIQHKRTRVERLVHHWVHCHELFERDLPRLERVLVVKYEQFVADPDAVLARVYDFVGVERHQRALAIRSDTNERYHRMWRERTAKRFVGRRSRTTTAALENRVRRFGYSLDDLGLCHPGTALAGAVQS